MLRDLARAATSQFYSRSSGCPHEELGPFSQTRRQSIIETSTVIKKEWHISCKLGAVILVSHRQRIILILPIFSSFYMCGYTNGTNAWTTYRPFRCFSVVDYDWWWFCHHFAAQCLAVGVESSDTIPDSAMTASSVYSDNYLPHYARVNDEQGRGWCPLTKEEVSYLQIDLGKKRRVCAVATQPAHGIAEYVEEYKLEFSRNGKKWSFYKEDDDVRVSGGDRLERLDLFISRAQFSVWSLQQASEIEAITLRAQDIAGITYMVSHESTNYALQFSSYPS